MATYDEFAAAEAAFDAQFPLYLAAGARLNAAEKARHGSLVLRIREVEDAQAAFDRAHAVHLAAVARYTDALDV